MNQISSYDTWHKPPKITGINEQTASLHGDGADNTLRQVDGQWQLYTGRRSRGRLQTRCMDNVKRSVGLAWIRIAQNRNLKKGKRCPWANKDEEGDPAVRMDNNFVTVKILI